MLCSPRTSGRFVAGHVDRVTEAGPPLVRIVASVFDAHLPRASEKRF